MEQQGCNYSLLFFSPRSLLLSTPLCSALSDKLRLMAEISAGSCLSPLHRVTAPVCEWESPFQIGSHSHDVNLAQCAKFRMLDYECVYNIHMDLASALIIFYGQGYRLGIQTGGLV